MLNKAKDKIPFIPIPDIPGGTSDERDDKHDNEIEDLKKRVKELEDEKKKREEDEEEKKKKAKTTIKLKSEGDDFKDSDGDGVSDAVEEAGARGELGGGSVPGGRPTNG